MNLKMVLAFIRPKNLRFRLLFVCLKHISSPYSYNDAFETVMANAA